MLERGAETESELYEDLPQEPVDPVAAEQEPVDPVAAEQDPVAAEQTPAVEEQEPAAGEQEPVAVEEEPVEQEPTEGGPEYEMQEEQAEQAPSAPTPVLPTPVFPTPVLPTPAFPPALVIPEVLGSIPVRITISYHFQSLYREYCNLRDAGDTIASTLGFFELLNWSTSFPFTFVSPQTLKDLFKKIYNPVSVTLSDQGVWNRFQTDWHVCMCTVSLINFKFFISEQLSLQLTEKLGILKSFDDPILRSLDVDECLALIQRAWKHKMDVMEEYGSVLRPTKLSSNPEYSGKDVWEHVARLVGANVGESAAFNWTNVKKIFVTALTKHQQSIIDTLRAPALTLPPPPAPETAGRSSRRIADRQAKRQRPPLTSYRAPGKRPSRPNSTVFSEAFYTE